MFTRKALFVSFLAFSLSLINLSFSSQAQDSWDEEGVIVYIKKIRDKENNYLRDVTKATAREVSKSGEFVAKPHKRSASGPVIEVSPPAFNFTQYKDGMNAKEMATAGLSIVSDVGTLFGFGEEAKTVNDMSARLNETNAILDAWGENEQVMVTMESRVVLTDADSGVEISRNISYENVFDSKSEFLAQKESLIQDAIVGEVKKVLVEYLEDDSGF